MKSVVVAAGSGNAGRAIIRDLLAHGYEVHGYEVAAGCRPRSCGK